MAAVVPQPAERQDQQPAGERKMLMAENSHISWTTHTFNTHWGCTKVSAGCKHCYADTLSTSRLKQNLWGPGADRKPMSDKYWSDLGKWEREAVKTGITPRVFCCSMSDLFEGPETCQNLDAYAVVTAARAQLFGAVEKTPHLLYLFLTKRPENMVKFAPASWADGWPSNVMAGTSVEDQAAADQRIPELLAVPARRFLSVEPLLGPVDLFRYLWQPADASEVSGQLLNDVGGVGLCVERRNALRWVIVGGESGPHARPMHPNWVRALRNQCAASGTLFHFKQWGEHAPSRSLPEGVFNEEYMNDDDTMYKVGKHKAGRILDGETYDDVPEREASS